MPCYHPMIRAENINRPYKTLDGKTAYKAQIWKANDLIDRLEHIKNNNSYRYDIIPCGKCIGCRLDYSRDWANRGYLEAKSWKENYFITLTYDEMNMPKNDVLRKEDEKTIRSYTGTVVKKDLQNFIKNVRQKKEREYQKKIEKGEKAEKPYIRFMACAEYGDENQRPHYHIIMYNLHLDAETFYEPRIKEGNVYWQNTFIEECWTKGISNISEATWHTIAYVARYITKKVTGKDSEQHYIERGQEREYMTMSTGIGIGKFYYNQHKEEIYKNDEIIVRTNKGVVSSKPPKYYDDLYKKEFPEKFKEIQRKRKRHQKAQNKLKDTLTSLSRLEQLNLDERTKEKQAKQLKRQLTKDLKKI